MDAGPDAGKEGADAGTDAGSRDAGADAGGVDAGHPADAGALEGLCGAASCACDDDGGFLWAQWSAPPDFPSNSQYSDNGDGTVTDHGTGLVWQQQLPSNPCPADGTGVCSWGDARSYCAGLNLGGLTGGWRLPSYVELLALIDFSGVSPAIDGRLFPGTPAARFWTSTPYQGGGSDAWSVDFTNGVVSEIAVSGNTLNVRCVH